MAKDKRRKKEIFQVVTTITSTLVIGEDGIEGVTHSVGVDGGEFGGIIGPDALSVLVQAACESAKIAAENTMGEAYAEAVAIATAEEGSDEEVSDDEQGSV